MVLDSPLTQVLEHGLMDEFVGGALQHSQDGSLGPDSEQLSKRRETNERVSAAGRGTAKKTANISECDGDLGNKLKTL